MNETTVKTADGKFMVEYLAITFPIPEPERSVLIAASRNASEMLNEYGDGSLAHKAAAKKSEAARDQIRAIHGIPTTREQIRVGA